MDPWTIAVSAVRDDLVGIERPLGGERGPVSMMPSGIGIVDLMIGFPVGTSPSEV